jgi:uncharacterized protein
MRIPRTHENASVSENVVDGRICAPAPRHVPIRQCVGCRERHPKAELVRFVSRPEGGWRLDDGVPLPGRGAYLCSARCAEKTKKNKKYRGLADAGWPHTREDL